jgi:hypothetical protein
MFRRWLTFVPAIALALALAGCHHKQCCNPAPVTTGSPCCPSPCGPGPVPGPANLPPAGVSVAPF